MDILEERLREILVLMPQRLIISKPRSKAAEVRKIVLEWKRDGYQAASYTEKQVFHKSVSRGDAFAFCLALLQGDYLQMDAWSTGREHMLMLTKKGAVSFKTRTVSDSESPKVAPAHNREKNYIIPEGTVIAPLVDMGIFTKEGKVVAAMYDKFKQINRFIELVDDVVKNSDFEHLNIIDFGCGKSYLTFILYYYFTEIRKIPVQIVGLDLKAEVIEKCNEAARRYGYSGLRFELGNIDGYTCKFPVDMVISLHACDTATDFALYNAVQWGAKMIFSVPCCQHELNGQIEGGDLALLTRYGIIKERFSALSTDAIRGALLEARGYSTQLLEFVDFSHTPKNILIRAVRKNITLAKKEAARLEAEQLMEAFHFRPTLYSLLYNKE